MGSMRCTRLFARHRRLMVAHELGVPPECLGRLHLSARDRCERAARSSSLSSRRSAAARRAAVSTATAITAESSPASDLPQHPHDKRDGSSGGSSGPPSRPTNFTPGPDSPASGTSIWDILVPGLQASENDALAMWFWDALLKLQLAEVGGTAEPRRCFPPAFVYQPLSTYHCPGPG
jgi:hypothetical protein